MFSTVETHFNVQYAYGTNLWYLSTIEMVDTDAYDVAALAFKNQVTVLANNIHLSGSDCIFSVQAFECNNYRNKFP